MNLEPAAQSLREQFPTGRRPDLDRRERRIEKFGALAFTGFMVVVTFAILGLLYAILDRLVFSGDNPLAGIGLMAFLIFAMLTLAYVVLREDMNEKRKKAGYDHAHTPAELQMPAVTGRLIEDKPFEPIPTVTESTTDLLPRRDRER